MEDIIIAIYLLSRWLLVDIDAMPMLHRSSSSFQLQIMLLLFFFFFSIRRAASGA